MMETLATPDTEKTIWHLINEEPNRWMFDHSHFPDDGRLLAEGLRAGTVIGVSDGSYMPHLTTS